MFVSGMSRYFSVFGPYICAVSTVCQLFEPMIEDYDRIVVGSLHYIV